MRTAIVFLANKPHENTIDFAIEVKRQTNFDTFVVIDDNTQYHGKSFKEVNLIQIPDKLCEESGYSHSVFIENESLLSFESDTFHEEKALQKPIAVESNYHFSSIYSFWHPPRI